MATGIVVGIYIAPEAKAPMVSVRAVRTVPGRGLEGDRYYHRQGTFWVPDNPGKEVTLVEKEALLALRRDYGIKLDAADTRRNIVTRGVALNHLVDRDFVIGGV